MAFTWKPVNFINDDPSTPLSAENLAAVQTGITQAGQLADGKLSDVSVGTGLLGDGTDGNPLKVGEGYLPYPYVINQTDFDFNTLQDGLTSILNNSNAVSNGPSEMGTMIRGCVLQIAMAGVNIQIFINSLVDKTNIYIRRSSLNTWSQWTSMYTSIAQSVAESMLSVASQQPMKLAALTTPESVTPELQSYIDQRVQAGINDFVQRFAAAYPMPVESADDGQSGLTVEKRADNG